MVFLEIGRDDRKRDEERDEDDVDGGIGDIGLVGNGDDVRDMVFCICHIRWG